MQARPEETDDKDQPKQKPGTKSSPMVTSMIFRMRQGGGGKLDAKMVHSRKVKRRSRSQVAEEVDG